MTWLAATIGATWVATWRLGTASTVNDEVVYRQAAVAMERRDWTANNQHPPLAKELIALADVVGRHLGASALVADRLPGVVCFVITGLLVGALAARVSAAASPPATGLVAALLWWALPLSPGVLVHHVDRYALLEAPMITAMVAAALLAAHLADRGPSPRPARAWGGWALLGACIGVATACKLLGVLVAPVALVPFVVAAATTRAPGGGVWRAGAGVALAAAASVTVFAATYAPMGHHAWTAVRTAVTFQVHHAGAGHLQTVAGRNYLFPPIWAPLWFQEQYLRPSATVALWAAAGLGVTTVATRARRAAGWVPVVALASCGLAVAAMSIKLPQYHDTLVPFLDVVAAIGLVRTAAVALGHRGAARQAPARHDAVRAGAWRLLAGALALTLVAPLVWRASDSLTALARLQPGDYRVAAGVLAAHGVSGQVVVWGDGPALAAQGYPVVTTPALPPDCRPVALVTDASVIHRLAGVDLAAWRRTCGAGYERVAIDRVTVYLRPGA